MIIHDAFEIALKSLRENYESNIIMAGRNNYREPWARDFSFASLGAVEVGDFEAVKKTLELFLRYQGMNGMFPLRVESSTLVMKGLSVVIGAAGSSGGKVREKTVPRYCTDYFTVPVDQNPLLVIAAVNYIKKSRDIAFAHRHFSDFERAVKWSLSQDVDGDYLVEQDPFADWADTVMGRNGKVLYTNVCFYKALKEMEEYAGLLGHWKKSIQYNSMAEKVKRALNRKFWLSKKGYYRNTEKISNLSADGNVLSIVWGVADERKGEAIEESISRFGMEKPVPLRAAHPRYDFYSVSGLAHFSGMGGYHDRWSWLWLGAFDCVAKHVLWDRKGAERELGRIAEIIVRDGTVYEIYDPRGRPVHTKFYKSDAPFSWSAGTFIWAAKQLGFG